MKYAKILEYARALRKGQTKAEAYFWKKVRNRKFQGFKFNRQFIIEHESHAYFITDFHCHQKKLIVEIDGGIHQYQIEKDKIREDILKEMGFRIVRFTNEEVLRNWRSVDKRLAGALAELTPSPSLKKREGRILKKFKGEFKEEAFKTVILGPESTGKTSLAKQLAEHFNTQWVPEYARQYIDELDRPYEESDLLEIAKNQLPYEDELARQANKFLFCDTNLITIKIWSDYKYGCTDHWILESLKTRKYDLYLLMDIDLPWEPDPQREHPESRQELFDLYKKHLDENDLPYEIASGLGHNRLENALRHVEVRTSNLL